MGYNIGPKIGIDGEAEFRQQIRDINTEYKALEAETRALSSAMEAQGDEQQKLLSHSKQLEKQIDAQKRKMSLLEDAVKKASDKYGENSIEATRLRGVLYDTQATISKLENELRGTNAEMEAFSSEALELAEKTRLLDEAEVSLGKQIRDLESAYKAIQSESKMLSAAFSSNEDESEKLKIQSEQLAKQIDNQRQKVSLLEDATNNASEKYGENSSEANRLRASLYDTQVTISNLENELADTSKRLENMAEGLEDVGQEAGQAEEAVLDFSDVLNANLVADLAADALQELGDAVVDFAKGMPDAAAEVKAAASQFDQTFGDMKASAQDALQAIAEETGITASRMQGSFTGIYAFSKTMGADSAEALDLSSRALLAAADSAAYYDKSVEEATQTLQSFLKGNYENDAALGISATETTRNTAANELYAKSFDALSESQKVDVLLSMVEAGNAASGALGQAAREADSWANVNGELDEAMRQLQATLGEPVLAEVVPIIQGITQGIYDLLEVSDWTQLNNSVKEFADSMEAVNQQFDTTVADADAAVYATESYLSRLEELEKAGLDTAQSQYEYRRIVEEINALIPGLNLTIDEQTGLLEQNKGAILDEARAWRDMEGVKATQQKLTDQIELRTQAENDLYEARYQLSTAEAEGASIEADLAQKKAELRQANQELAAVMAQTSQSSYSAADGVKDLSEEEEAARSKAEALAREVMGLEARLDSNQRTQENLTGSIADAQKTISDYDEQIASTSASLEEYEQATGDASDSQEDLQESASATQEQIDALAEAYALAKEEALASIESQIGLFDELSAESSMSAQEIIDNWNAQQQAFLNYEDNLKKAVDMGLDEALVRQLADGSEQSMAILDELVNGTELSVDEINAAFRDRMTAADSAATEMAAVQGVLDESTAGWYDDMYASGKAVAEGIAKGMNDNAYLVSQAVTLLAGKPKIFNTVNEISSPSRLMKRSGRDIVLGAVVGIDENAKRLEESMANLATAGRDAYLDERLDAIERFPVTMEFPAVSSGSTHTQTTNYGGISINIYQQPGEDAQDLAYRVMDIIQAEVASEEVAFR